MKKMIFFAILGISSLNFGSEPSKSARATTPENQRFAGTVEVLDRQAKIQRDQERAAGRAAHQSSSKSGGPVRKLF